MEIVIRECVGQSTINWPIGDDNRFVTEISNLSFRILIRNLHMVGIERCAMSQRFLLKVLLVKWMRNGVCWWSQIPIFRYFTVSLELHLPAPNTDCHVIRFLFLDRSTWCWYALIVWLMPWRILYLIFIAFDTVINGTYARATRKKNHKPWNSEQLTRNYSRSRHG